MSKSNIEWTEDTWNPIVGCSILSPGCTNCYAMKMAARIEAMQLAEHERGKRPILGHYFGMTKKINGNPVWTGEINLAPDNILLQPLKRKKPTTYFVNSMSDLFHEDVPDAWIDKVFAVMALAPQHTFQVLTKRAKRMREYLTRAAGNGKQEVRNHIAWIAVPEIMNAWFPDWPREGVNEPHRSRAIRAGTEWPLPNVWLGVSTERQQEADERIPLLLQTPAAIRFISAEPLLGPINLDRIHEGYDTPEGARVDMWESCLNGKRYDMWADDDEDPMKPGHPKLDWVIVGGESGPDARPMHPDWARRLREQCKAAGVPFFFKQWGEWFPCAGDEQRAHPKALRSNPDNHEAAWPDGTVGNGHHRKNGGVGYPLLRVGKKAAGRSLDGMIHNEYPGGAR